MITATQPYPSQPSSSGTWFEYLSRPRLPSLRVFCFPYAGGAVDIYRPWQRWLPESIELCLVHLPGHGRNRAHRAFTRLIPLAQSLADRMAPQPEIPYAFYGHSMGALVAFELARELFRRYGSGPQHLFVSGQGGPQCAPTRPPRFNLPQEELILELRSLNGTPVQVLENQELMEFFLDVLRADFETVDTYEYRAGQPLPCPITVYRGVSDKEVPETTCHEWREQTSASCIARLFEGDHFFIRTPEAEFISAFRDDLLNAVSSGHTFK